MAQERRDKDIVRNELESVLRQMESGDDRGAALARGTRELMALKRKNQQMASRLEDQREHYEEMGAKASRRVSKELK